LKKYNNNKFNKKSLIGKKNWKEFKKKEFKKKEFKKKEFKKKDWKKKNKKNKNIIWNTTRKQSNKKFKYIY